MANGSRSLMSESLIMVDWEVSKKMRMDSCGVKEMEKFGKESIQWERL